MPSRRNENSKARSIALCVIAKNEERFIADCLESARPFVDEVIVVDTGSTDGTVEIAREHGARVEHFKWCDDFSAARNAAIDAATADWILMLDADERLDVESGPLLRQAIALAPDSLHALCPVIENRSLSGTGLAALSLSVPRLFPRRPDIRFVGSIHEVPKYLPNPSRTQVGRAEGIHIIHFGYDKSVYEARSKDSRNVALLQRELERGSNDKRLPFFLMQQHVISERYREGVEVFERFATEIHQLPSRFVVQSYFFYMQALNHLEDRVALERAATEAAERNVLGGPAIDVLSDFYARAGDLDRAIEWLERQLQMDLPVGLEVAEGQGTWRTRLKLAELCYKRGDRNGEYRQAFDHVELAFGGLPHDRRGPIALDLASSAVRIEDLDLATRWLKRALDHGEQTFEAQRQLFELTVQLASRIPTSRLSSPHREFDAAFVNDDLQATYDLASQLPSTMAGSVRILAFCERLRDLGEQQAALSLLNRALDGPRLEQIYWLLIQVLTDLGRYQDAQLALDAMRVHKQRAQAA